MRLEIDRVPAGGLTLEAFVSGYLLPEKPVVITELHTFDPDVLTPAFVKDTFADESKREAGWFDASLVDDGVIRVPELVKQVMARPDMSVRESPMRLFMQPGGHITLPHYDGNSLHGLNQQVLGRKRWILTSPDTPLPNVPFMFVGMVGDKFHYDPHRHDFYDFETRPGEMLFVPRYYYHEVHSLEPVNLNLNWVFTPTAPNEQTRLGRREVEIVKLRDRWPVVNRAFFPDDFTNYGGAGTELIAAYSEGVSRTRMVKRLLIELAGYPRLLMLMGQIRRRAKAFSDNNFEV